jgi:chromosome segregation ATPase
MDIPPMVKQILNKPDNYGPTTELPKEFRVYHPLNAEVEKAKSDQFNKAGDKQYWAESDFLIPNLNVMEEDTMESLREGVEKDLAAINKEAEHEVLQSKMEKIQALIDKKQSQISKLDEDEDMKDLTDDKKVKEISKDIKALEKAKAKLEKIMSKFKGKKPESKKVIDEIDNAEEAVSNIALEYIEDANERLENGEEIDSILSNYQNLSFDDRNHLKNYLNWKQGEQPGLNSELGVEDEY